MKEGLSYLRQGMFWGLPILLVLFCSYYLYSSFQTRQKIAYDNAEKMSLHINDALQGFHEYYSDNVVDRLRQSEQEITISHKYKTIPTAIPLPGTMVQEMSGVFAAWSGVDISFFSEYPFPYSSKRKLSDYELDALTFYRSNPKSEVFQKRYVEGDKQLITYAYPSIMRESCVSCHNNHEASPRTDWEVGDIRGVLLVKQPINIASLLPKHFADRAYISVSLIAFFSLFLVNSIFRQRANSVLREHTLILENEVQQRKTSEERLLLAKQEAERANQAKSTFLASMSHELRTPLNAIIGFSQILDRDQSLNPKQSGFIHTISSSGKHLLSLINDVLDMSKIEAGKSTYEPTTVDLAKLLDFLTTLFEPKAIEKGLSFSIKSNVEKPQLLVTDEQKLRQVLINLLSNAIKFTEIGSVQLEVILNRNQSIDFIVSDTGRGIAPSQVKALFQPFEQLDSTDSAKGTGLGLTISNKFVELLGGDMSVQSKVNEGSCFRFNIPYGEPSVQESTARPLDTFDFTKQQFKILVAEDNHYNLEMMKELLKDFEVLEARNGQEAIEVATNQSPDLICMDIQMPILDGVEATKQLRSNGFDKPIIAITASILEITSDINQYFDIVLAKPLDENELFTAFSNLLNIKIQSKVKKNPQAQNRITDLTTLPENIKSEIRSAITNLDMGKLKQLANSIAEVSPDSTPIYNDLIYAYNFEELESLMDMNEGGAHV